MEVVEMKRILLAWRLAKTALVRPEFVETVWVLGVEQVYANHPASRSITHHAGALTH